MQRSAFLEFRITDKTSALEKALPGDGPARSESLGVEGGRSRRKPSAVEQLLGGDTREAAPKRAAPTPARSATAEQGRRCAGHRAGRTPRRSGGVLAG